MSSKFKVKKPVMVRITSLFIVILLSFCIVPGCSNEPSKVNILIGSWFLTERSFIYILSFRANGSFVISKRKVGQDTKVTGKKKQAEGEWEVEEKQLLLRILKSDKLKDWEKDTTLFFEVLVMTSELLELKTSDEKLIAWKRVKAGRAIDDQDSGEGQLVLMKPVIVNLAKKRPVDKEMYMCLIIGFLLDSPVALPEEKEEPIVPAIHPKVRDAVLFYLGAQTHKNISTFDKLNKVKRNLKEILMPYFEGSLKGIEIKNIVITSSWESVEDFKAEYSESKDDAVDAETDGDKEEKK
ncbi:MAG: hypothetical protein B6I31_03785 [Desulfobacteraceae bacterium 4572_19]|nr:MAG: hypothetical protein B6I31_03785 [Desulfobacteraceae bacterium 4572_19]